MRSLPGEFAEYRWAPSTAAIAAAAGIDPVEVIRFDGNVPAAPSPTARPGAIAGPASRALHRQAGSRPGEFSRARLNETERAYEP